MGGYIAIGVLVVLILILVVSSIHVVQQSKAFVVERLGSFSAVWQRPPLEVALYRARGEEDQPEGAGGGLRSPAGHHQG